MKRLFKQASTLSAGLALSLASMAGMIVDTESQYEYVGWFDSYSYSHNLNDEGFVLGSAVSGLLDVEIFDDSQDGSWIWQFELSALNIEGDWVDFSLGSNFNDVQISGQALASINQDGYLDVTVQSLWGDFYVGDSVLTLTTNDSSSSSTSTTVSVPEPGVTVLLLAGLVGLGVARKVTV